MKQRRNQQQPKKSSSTWVLAVLVLWTCVILGGCSESPKKAPAPQPAASKPTAQPIAPQQPAASKPTAQPIAPQQITPEIPSAGTGKEKLDVEYTYVPGGRRDPFAPIVVREEKKEPKAALPQLERYPVVEFKLTGIVWGGFGYNAMLEGPDGKGYFVRVGTVIGQNRGVVKKITKDALTVEEKFKTYLGDTERKEITITLHKKQEGLP